MLIPLNLVRDQPLQQQLYEQLQGLIASARLRPGVRMPSTRALAEQFGISRNTTLLTYERLIAEGYLATLPAKGTFVVRPPVRLARGLAEPQAPPGPAGAGPRAGQEAHLGNNPAASHARAEEARVGCPDPSLFPAGRWRALMRGALDGMGARLGSEHPDGNPVLRIAVADWLSTSRGLAVAPEQVVLVNGRQQALHLVAHLTLRPGTRAVVEDPCDAAAAAVLAGGSADLVRVPVDANGLRTDCLPTCRSAVPMAGGPMAGGPLAGGPLAGVPLAGVPLAGRPLAGAAMGMLPGADVALVHVTPEHQRPLGVSMSRGRRIALLAWAERTGALVLEEDCEGELRYGDTSVPSLLSLDTEGRVILLGGFCTSLGPWVGMAYLVLPRRLLAAAHAARRMIDDSRHRLEETALAELLGSGFYARHLHRLGKAYASRRDALLTALRHNFGEPAATWGAHAGLHLSWFPPMDDVSPVYLASLARRCGLEAAAVPADIAVRRSDAQPVLLGFGALPERQLTARVAQFAERAQARGPVAALSAD